MPIITPLEKGDEICDVGSKPSLEIHNDYRHNGELSDLQILVHGEQFCLHKYPLFTHSELIKQLLENETSKDEKVTLELKDFPGDGQIFSKIADFSYGLPVTLTPKNSVELSCAAHFMQMKGPRNLEEKADQLIQDVLSTARLTKNLPDVLEIIQSSLSGYDYPKKKQISQQCTESIADIWLQSCKSSHYQPYKSASSERTMQQLVKLPENAIKELFRSATEAEIKSCLWGELMQKLIETAYEKEILNTKNAKEDAKTGSNKNNENGNAFNSNNSQGKTILGAHSNSNKKESETNSSIKHTKPSTKEEQENNDRKNINSKDDQGPNSTNKFSGKGNLRTQNTPAGVEKKEGDSRTKLAQPQNGSDDRKKLGIVGDSTFMHFDGYLPVKMQSSKKKTDPEKESHASKNQQQKTKENQGNDEIKRQDVFQQLAAAPKRPADERYNVADEIEQEEVKSETKVLLPCTSEEEKRLYADILERNLGDLPVNVPLAQGCEPNWLFECLNLSSEKDLRCRPLFLYQVSHALPRMDPRIVENIDVALMEELSEVFLGKSENSSQNKDKEREGEEGANEETDTITEERSEIADSIDNYLAQNAKKKNQIDVASFISIASKVPKNVRSSHDTLFKGVEELINKEGITEAQKKELCALIDFRCLSESSLKRADQFVPKEFVSDAALALCEKLRAQLDTAKSVINIQDEEIERLKNPYGCSTDRSGYSSSYKDYLGSDSYLDRTSKYSHPSSKSYRRPYWLHKGNLRPSSAHYDSYTHRSYKHRPNYQSKLTEKHGGSNSYQSSLPKPRYSLHLDAARARIDEEYLQTLKLQADYYRSLVEAEREMLNMTLYDDIYRYPTTTYFP